MRVKLILRNILVRYYTNLTSIGEIASYLLLFFTGVGRYRVIVCMAIAGVFRIITNSLGFDKTIMNAIIITFVLPLLYLDISKGQLYPIFPELHIVISACVSLITIFIVNIYLERLAQKVTCNEVFTYCLRCRYENTHLVNKCANCKATVSDFKNVNAYYKKPDSLLDIVDDENIINVYHIGTFRGVYKDGVKILATKMCITNINIIFIDYSIFNKGWTSKEIINNKHVDKILISKKKHNKVEAPILTLTTSHGSTFEIFYYADDSATVRLIEIANCLKLQNTSIEICNLINS